ncbi:MAG: hypothetical protein KGM24_13030 [Elusimicrobia bacterium]|nr:hypothetical protein [Elusimicrobiota bacterium]
MSLREFLDSGRLKRHKATAEEIGKLFEIVKRDLADAHVRGLSDDRRYTIAYNAALQAGRACLAAEGYRTAGQGHHHTVFQALRHVLPKERHHVLDYLDDCRSKRNLAEYLGTEVASEHEVSELVREAQSFSKLLHEFIRARHPQLVK